MLRNAKTLLGHELRARDGRIGHVGDFYFDDRRWVVRYFVVETGGWLDGRTVLISPVAVHAPEWEKRSLPVDLTKEQVRNSPGIETHMVTPEDEVRLAGYYSWPPYWIAPGFLEGGFGLPFIPLPAAQPASRPVASDGPSETDGQRERNGHRLRSVHQVTGHAIEAVDGAIGHVEDVVLDDETWRIRFVLVDTRNWWAGKKVLVGPERIRGVNWDEARVLVDLTRAEIQLSPEFDPRSPNATDYAHQVEDYYAQLPHHVS
jgi:uncharacterized protein YrrD